MSKEAFNSEAIAFAEHLKNTLGNACVLLPDEFAGRQLNDLSNLPSAMPGAIVRPRNTEEVSETLKLCHTHGQSVVTQGGLTGLTGGACLLGGEIVLSLERMRGIEDIDPVSMTMTVLSGTPLQAIQEAADEVGLLFPLDLGARGSCTIGGNLATNAGGNRVIKYGMARDQVLDIEAVTADGSIIGGTKRMIKNNTGYDLRHLLIGSEGTLAVITRIVLRLRPKPGGVATAFCGLPDYEAVTTLLSSARSELPAGVSAFEVMWPGYYDFVLNGLPALRKPLSGSHGFYVLVESEGNDQEKHTEGFEAWLGAMFECGILQDAALANSEANAREFWAIRDAPGEYGKLIPGYSAFDISFSTAEVNIAANRIEAELKQRRPESLLLLYGHLGDGNLHIVVHERNWSAADKEEVNEVVYRITGEMNGSVSAEHGIGLQKRKVLGLSRTPADIAVMQAIKKALDPRGILNPGKLLP